MAKLAAVRRGAPKPWTVRLAMSTVMFGETPQAIEASVNTVSPRAKIRRRQPDDARRQSEPVAPLRQSTSKQGIVWMTPASQGGRASQHQYIG